MLSEQILQHLLVETRVYFHAHTVSNIMLQACTKRAGKTI